MDRKYLTGGYSYLDCNGGQWKDGYGKIHYLHEMVDNHLANAYLTVLKDLNTGINIIEDDEDKRKERKILLEEMMQLKLYEIEECLRDRDLPIPELQTKVRKSKK